MKAEAVARLFIAARLPEAVLGAIAETSSNLQRTVRANYSRRENYHITLAFLGNTDLSLTSDIQEAMDDAIGRETSLSKRLSLGGLGFFGKPGNAILWRGIKSDYPLDGLSAKLGSRLELNGIDFDRKPFNPHITIARKADLTHVTLTDHSPPDASGDIPSIALFVSERKNGVLTYTPIYEKNL